MKLKKITLKNFRRFQQKITLDLNKEFNVIIGENNSGKSSFFSAIKKVNLFAKLRTNTQIIRNGQEESIFTKSDWSYEKEDDELLIDLLLEISDSEKKSVLDNFAFDKVVDEYLIDEFRNSFKNELRVVFKNRFSRNLVPPFVQFGEFYFFRNELTKKDNFGEDVSYGMRDFRQICVDAKKGDRTILSEANTFLNSKDPVRIKMENQNVYDLCLSICSNNFKLFSEIRQKPTMTETSAIESLDGSETASVLFALKTGNPDSREKYDSIRNLFATYFPGISFEVVKKDGAIDIKIMPSKERKYEHSLNQTGTGTMEFIVILTALLGAKESVFVFEEPEIHLHPSAQKNLFKFLQERSETNQIIVITHSIHFVDITNISNNYVFKLNHDNNSFSIANLKSGFFSEIESKKISKALCGINRELFFATKILLVEGPTEYGAIPVFAQTMKKDLDLLNIFVCAVDGKGSFGLYQKLLDSINEEYFILCDRDNVPLPKTIEEHLKKLVLPTNFESFLSDAGFSELFTEAKRECSGKPLRGAYVAERIPAEKIPLEIKSLIEQLTTFDKKSDLCE